MYHVGRFDLKEFQALFQQSVYGNVKGTIDSLITIDEENSQNAGHVKSFRIRTENRGSFLVADSLNLERSYLGILRHYAEIGDLVWIIGRENPRENDMPIVVPKLLFNETANVALDYRNIRSML